MYSPGTSSLDSGGSTRNLPPLPLSTPVVPMSASEFCHRSLMTAEHRRRNLEHDGTVALEVERGQTVDRLGVPRQHERRRVHQRFPDHQLVRLARARLDHAPPDVQPRHRRHVDEIRFHRANEHERVAQLARRRAGREAVLELESSEPRPDRFRAEPAVPFRRFGWSASYLRGHRLPPPTDASPARTLRPLPSRGPGTPRRRRRTRRRESCRR